MFGLKRLILRGLALRNERYDSLYRFMCAPNGTDWAEFLKERGDFYAMGEDCYIDPYATIQDRALIRIGNNVRINACMMMCHDGSVNMINKATGLTLDSVGRIDIRDNVYIGYGVIVLPGVSIGPNAIVSAGSLVRSDVGPGDVVAGVPAVRRGRFDLTVQFLKEKNQLYPWSKLIVSRKELGDLELEQTLLEKRIEFFYGGE